jgi:predicted nucleotidyltransferase
VNHGTPSLDHILSQIRAHMPVLRSLGAARIGVFGSRARGQAQPQSDVDVLVSLAPHRDLIDLIAIRDHLSELLGLPVDAVTESGLRPDAREAILRDTHYAA